MRPSGRPPIAQATPIRANPTRRSETACANEFHVAWSNAEKSTANTIVNVTAQAPRRGTLREPRSTPSGGACLDGIWKSDSSTPPRKTSASPGSHFVSAASKSGYSAAHERYVSPRRGRPGNRQHGVRVRRARRFRGQRSTSLSHCLHRPAHRVRHGRRQRGPVGSVGDHRPAARREVHVVGRGGRYGGAGAVARRRGHRRQASR